MEIKRYLPSIIYYRVKAEENINQIAKTFNISTLNVKTNGVDIEEGDFVEIRNAFENVHVVKPLETLKQIADMHNLTEDYIMKINSLKSKILFVGQRIRL